MIITEDILRQIVRNALLEAIEEGGTNMESLYHFTDINSLSRIFSTGYLKTNQWQTDKRNGKRFISFTRHKSNLEGFGYARECDVRIEVDGQKLNSMHGNVYPYEYYSPKRAWSRIHEDPRTAKMKYQNAHAEGTHKSGEESYFHQSEESFETTREFLDLENIVKRIDILMPENLSKIIGGMKNEQKNEWVLKITSLTSNSSPLTNCTFVYESKKDFNLQTENCIPLRQYADKIVEYAYYRSRQEEPAAE